MRKMGRVGAAVTSGVTLVLVVVFITFIVALVTNASKRIPGVVDVLVTATPDEASVEMAWHAGLLVVFAIGFAATFVLGHRRSA